MHQFRIHPNINPDIALAFDIAKLDLNNLPLLPNDWLEQLAGFDKDDAENFLKNLEGKVGEESTYSKKPELVNALQIIYYRVSGNLNAQVGPVTQGEISATVIKLKEGVVNCTPGFHDRVNAIVNGYHRPKTFSQLLTKIRETLVLRTATQLTSEVHANNRVFYVASTLGLGVAVPHKQDVYRGAISGKNIRNALQQTFNTYFTPLNLPFLIKDELESVLTYFGYHGPMDENSEGYVMGVYEEIRAYIGNVFQNLFSEKSPDLEALFKVTDNSALIAINWHYLCHVIFDALLSPHNPHTVIQGIDNILEVSVTSLTDCAMLSVLLFDNQLLGKEPELLQTISYSTLAEIQQISKRFPDYGHCLKNCIKESRIFDDQLNGLLKNLINKMSVEVTAEKFQQMIYLLDAISPEKYQEIIVNLINKGFSKETFTFLQLICVTGNREQQDALLTYLIANFGIEVVKQMLSQTAKGWNALIITARYNSEAFFQLLDFIGNHWNELEVKYIQNMLLQEDTSRDCNALMIAAEYQPEAFSKFLDFITVHWDKLGEECIRQMLSRGPWNDYNALMVTARHQPEAFSKFLDFIETHWDKFGAKYIRAMLLQTDRDGCNAVMMAVDKKAEVFFKILNFFATRWNDLGIGWVDSKLFRQQAWNESKIHGAINFISEISVYENAREFIFTFFIYFKYISEKMKQAIQANMQPHDVLLSYENEKDIAKHATAALVILGQDKFCDEFLAMIKRNFAAKPQDCLGLLRQSANDKSFLGCCFANHSTNSVVRFFSSNTTPSQDKIKSVLADYEASFEVEIANQESRAHSRN